MGSGKDGPRTGGQFRCDLIEVELPSVSYPGAFQPDWSCKEAFAELRDGKDPRGITREESLTGVRKKIDEIVLIF
jgi:hypothetical protein